MHMRHYRLAFLRHTPLPLTLHGDEPALETLGPALEEAAAQQLGKLELGKETLPAALLLAVDMRAKPEEQAANLKELADRLETLAPLRGEACRVSGLPVFLILVHAESLAGQETDAESWLGRVNTTLMEKSHQFLTLLHERGLQDRRHFGTLAVHILALANTPEPTPHSATALLQQVRQAAQQFLHRQRRQAWRTWGISFLSGLSLLLLLALSVLLGWDLLARTSLPPQPPAEKQVDPVVQLSQQLQRLLRFEGYRRGTPAVTQWVPWYQDASQALALCDRVESPSVPEWDKVKQMAAQVRSMRERILFLGLVRVENPPIPVLRPWSEPVPTLAQIQTTATTLRDYLQQRSYFSRETAWPEEMPQAVVQELRAAAERAYEAWLEPVRRLLGQGAAKQGDVNREAWLHVVRVWLPQEALPQLQEWQAVATFLQQQAGLPFQDLVAELTAFVEREQTVLDFRRVRLLLPSEIIGSDGKARELRPESLEVVWQESDKPPERWPFRLERRTPLLGKPLAVYEFQRQDVAEQKAGLLTYHAGQSLSATVICEMQGERWRVVWSVTDRAVRWAGLHIFTEAPRLVPEQQPDPRQGLLLPSARWLAPAMDAWKLPALWPRNGEQP
jgi:hypothetical protein